MTMGVTTEQAGSVEHGVAIPRARQEAPGPVTNPAPAPERSEPPQADVPARCRCGHPEAAHEHFRPGSDCGACGATQCARYRPTARRRGLVETLRRAVRRAR